MLLADFDRGQIRYAAIGGFALSVFGAARATVDLDFLIHREDLDALHRILTSLGYQRLAQTENVSHYVHPDALWGSLDFVHAFRQPSLRMLDRATSYPIFGGTQHLRVAAPEDVIGLKVQAMVNDPSRRGKELVDIQALVERHGPTLDWQRIQEYFDIFEIGEEAGRLRERFGHAER